ncbi:ABC transporter ATP-binding protein [Patescibacteria group bacterium]|nr:ABC transporter ATP-binding protein [Patescibacteria group bacterium]MBU1952029.1 ABC transporter ATP-binding protein [Patescibacteria group bacterium]
MANGKDKKTTKNGNKKNGNTKKRNGTGVKNGSKLNEAATRQPTNSSAKNGASISELATQVGESKKTTTDSKKPIIELQHVNKSFEVGKSTIPVLKDINIKIYPREFIIILGPSGSGKSTLLNTLLGLEYPTSGKVIINKQDITELSPNKLAKFRYSVFGIVFQRADWVRSLNVIQNVAMPLAINNVGNKERMDIALSRLKEMGIDDHSNYMPAELSGGQQQKVSVARSLTGNPPILVADEPTGNLDTESAGKVMRFFRDLNERLEKTLLMVTHNIDYVSYATRTIYIRDGKIVEGSGSFKE